ncbi:substrate-binding domain-containing protein [Kitasatospora sp. MAP5-34]|uniref:sugar ABC transporter substrate-binding protein n=1 Tax=Kitasatospora sp. MAP5-34 TaxID=3035102 RepID=UPI00247523C9|nr:substrate-binding domain-containing protein [Kitasatospora sp. MAP5-34]MDH6575398.1 D-xylose transport system substrate-binding protein [Kitasatospora sp. MAP5-34]
MNAMTRRTIVGTAVVSMALTLAACGQSGSAPKTATSKTVGLLLPEKTSSARYETFDKPLIEASITGLCKCTVDYSNANGEETTQKEQFDALLAKGVKVILLDPVNAKNTASWVDEATRKGTKVIAYDRLAAGNVAAYVSFDNERTGELQGQAMLDALGSKAANAQIVMINGAEADPNAADFKAGAHKVLDGKVKHIGYEQSGEWKPDVAAQKMTDAIHSLGKDGIQGVYSANDGMAASIVQTLQANGMNNVPVGGQDAAIDAIRRVISGEQAYTIYKPYKPEADAAANIAVYLLEGLDITSVASSITPSGGAEIPSMLLTPLVVTKQTVADTVIAGGLYKASDVCNQQYADACNTLGIK